MRTVLPCLALLSSLEAVDAHGWVTTPVSKNELEYSHWRAGMPVDLRYEPQSCNIGNGIGHVGTDGGSSCGSKNVNTTLGLSVWQSLYDDAGVQVPRLTPGEDMQFNITLTIDHGGQAWMMIACAETIREDNDWLLLERSMKDRDAHFMPSSPTAFAWAPNEFGVASLSAWWHVPKAFSCPTNRVVGRWLWKTGNTCDDVHNIARKTDNFTVQDISNVVQNYTKTKPWILVCKNPPETFISCMDFVVGPPAVPTPKPAPTPPAPTPPPTPPTPAAPTPPLPTPPPSPCARAWTRCAATSDCCGKCTCSGGDCHPSSPGAGSC
jgi:hypothetical protein